MTSSTYIIEQSIHVRGGLDAVISAHTLLALVMVLKASMSPLLKASSSCCSHALGVLASAFTADVQTTSPKLKMPSPVIAAKLLHGTYDG